MIDHEEEKEEEEEEERNETQLGKIITRNLRLLFHFREEEG